MELTPGDSATSKGPGLLRRQHDVGAHPGPALVAQSPAVGGHGSRSLFEERLDGRVLTPNTLSRSAFSSPSTTMCVSAVRAPGALTMKYRYAARTGERPTRVQHCADRPVVWDRVERWGDRPEGGAGVGVQVRAAGDAVVAVLQVVGPVAAGIPDLDVCSRHGFADRVAHGAFDPARSSDTGIGDVPALSGRGGVVGEGVDDGRLGGSAAGLIVDRDRLDRTMPRPAR